jgi:glyoxylase-like metal-dependent hydrolase (beta-lactamase superfamily II)
MDAARVFTRRTFLADLGRGSVALAVVSIAGCAPGSSASGGPGATATASGGPAGATPAPSTSSAEPSTAGGFDWTRVDLGFVSAYILVRDGEAGIVDTGVPGSAAAIATALGGVGLDWTAVGHVILTHKHDDHAGSAAEVLEAATSATGYAGAEDLAAITSPRDLVAVADGDGVFGLRIVATPGHTPGHVAVLDEIGGILVAGDALGTSGGTVTGPNPQFSEDLAAAKASVAKMGALRFETLLVGHGDPILTGASAEVAKLAAG